MIGSTDMGMTPQGSFLNIHYPYWDKYSRSFLILVHSDCLAPTFQKFNWIEWFLSMSQKISCKDMYLSKFRIIFPMLTGNYEICRNRDLEEATPLSTFYEINWILIYCVMTYIDPCFGSFSDVNWKYEICRNRDLILPLPSAVAVNMWTFASTYPVGLHGL